MNSAHPLPEQAAATSKLPAHLYEVDISDVGPAFFEIISTLARLEGRYGKSVIMGITKDYFKKIGLSDYQITRIPKIVSPLIEYSKELYGELPEIEKSSQKKREFGNKSPLELEGEELFRKKVEEKEEYKIFSNECRKGGDLNDVEYRRERKKYKDKLDDYVIIIDEPDNAFYFEGKKIDNAKTEVIDFLKPLLKNRKHEATYEDIYFSVKKEKRTEVAESEKNQLHCWRTALINTLGKRFLLYFENFPGIGYKLKFGIDTKYLLLDYLLDESV